MPSALTRDVGFKIGPVLLDVLAKHYFDKRKENGDSPESVKLRKDEILFDEAFNLVKSFLNTAVWHTVEDLQAFSNTRTPSPPWVKVVRLLVPMSSCDEAATHLIRVLGGEEFCRQLVGGIKWWQVRGLPGVDGQWIVAKRDWREAKKRDKMHRQGQPASKQSQSTTESTEEEEGTYNKDMDEMRCILFLHGGGFYFGSVDQERYSIQRLARKINGRVFAINYRLAPQYPFPCALQDALAAYLYLIRPPPGSPHTPVDPAHIVIAGDSAGGALALALLQVIRDAALPAPAGGLLISPWCDLTHSFPSIHLNTNTDVIPDCGLSFHKPSTLWPPPPEEVSNRVHASLRHRIRQAFTFDGPAPYNPTDTVVPQQDADTLHVPPTPSTIRAAEVGVNVGSTTHLPHPSESEGGRKISLTTESNEKLKVDRQLHFYTENTLLTHPLVSAAMSYLGGLPPLFFVLGDKEVLRDEGIYSAHKAASPQRFSISESSKELYPPLKNLKAEDMKPTSVHLQVYDDAPHVLPILFAFTTPAKFCFRAMATFTKFVTNMAVMSPPLASPPDFISTSPEPSISDKNPDIDSSEPFKSSSLMPDSHTQNRLSRRLSRRLSFRVPDMLRNRSVSSSLLRRTSEGSAGQSSGQQSPPTAFAQFDLPSSSSSFFGPSSPLASPLPMTESEETDVGGPRFSLSTPRVPTRGERFAGEASTYSYIRDTRNWECGMIRERVGIDGVIRPLEPEEELTAMKVPEDVIGKLSELTLRRCIDFQEKFDKKFAHTYKQVEKLRRKNLERAKQDTIKQLSQLRKTIINKDSTAGQSSGNFEVNGVPANGSSKGAGEKGRSGSGDSAFKDLLLSTPGWSWAWALDEHEHPPPSSIVSRRDTEEARKLAESADLALLGQDHTFSGNNLWSIVVNFLTVTPGKTKVLKTASGDIHATKEEPEKPEKTRSRFKLSKVFKAEYNRQ